jgi:hypothetical protein
LTILWFWKKTERKKERKKESKTDKFMNRENGVED